VVPWKNGSVSLRDFGVHWNVDDTIFHLFILTVLILLIVYLSRVVASSTMAFGLKVARVVTKAKHAVFAAFALLLLAVLRLEVLAHESLAIFSIFLDNVVVAHNSLAIVVALVALLPRLFLLFDLLAHLLRLAVEGLLVLLVLLVRIVVLAVWVVHLGEDRHVLHVIFVI